ncbi:MAG TPA: c-type cytochrome [Candidatus Acidoferrum sp.]|nr:c-type cytochrome [Candidatus Acidoferrum sp.]
MRSFLHPCFFFLVLGALLLSGCEMSPGRPGKDSEILAPDEILDFKILYGENCAGCHGAEGRGGAAIALADPVYLAIADEAAIRKVIAQGVRGTSMPAFAQSAGGMLTEKQVDVITRQIRASWSRSGILNGIDAPSYAAKTAGDPARGEIAYKTYCESCHGSDGRGGKRGSSITDGAFLALVSDHGLRTLIISGRPELNAPDWRSNVAGKPMSEQEITDVVAWLASKRVQNPGQPYPAAPNTPAPGAR